MWARIEDGKVAELTDVDPVGRFHKSLIWQPCPANAQEGWRYTAEGYEPPLGPGPDELAEIERAWRTAELLGNEWLVTRHRDEVDLALNPTLTGEQFSQLLMYRQELREWPQTSSFPAGDLRPAAPPWIAEQIH